VSYDQLLDLLQVNRQYREDYVATPPAACPDDGILLEAGPEGELHCPWGHFVVQTGDRWVTSTRP